MSAPPITVIPAANRLRLGRPPERVRDNTRIAAVMTTTSARTWVKITARELLASRTTVLRMNTHVATNNDVATMTPSRISRQGTRRTDSDSSSNDAVAPTGYHSSAVSAAVGCAA